MRSASSGITSIQSRRLCPVQPRLLSKMTWEAREAVDRGPVSTSKSFEPNRLVFINRNEFYLLIGQRRDHPEGTRNFFLGGGRFNSINRVSQLNFPKKFLWRKLKGIY